MTAPAPVEAAYRDLVSARTCQLLGMDESAEELHHRARQSLYAAGHTLSSAMATIWATQRDINAAAEQTLFDLGIEVPVGYQGRRQRCECEDPRWNAWERCCSLCGGRINGGT